MSKSPAGILTVGVVTRPFGFEGRRRDAAARAGIDALRGAVDCVIIIPNDNLTALAGKNMTLQSAFMLADDVLRQGVQGISDIILVPGLINIDFADVKTVMANSGTAMLGSGSGRGACGSDRAVEAAEQAAMMPLIQRSIEKATSECQHSWHCRHAAVCHSVCSMACAQVVFRASHTPAHHRGSGMCVYDTLLRPETAIETSCTPLTPHREFAAYHPQD